MTVHFQDARVTLHAGDCLDVLRSLPDSSVDSVCTDPPYGLEFMGKDWDAPWKASMRDRGKLPGSHATNPTPRPKDYAVAGLPFQRWCEEWAAECLRVLKPGGHLLAFGGTRTWHRLACAVEDAGFEIRDSIAWLYGSGFPKSLDVSKAIDKRAEVNAETKRRIALVAEVIRTHREAKGMERSAVSLAVVGTPSGACWNWEHQQLPSVEMWPAIKATLDIPDEFDGLIEGDRAQFIAAERAVIRERTMTQGGGTSLQIRMGEAREVRADVTAPATDAARQWAGWGTALKPAHEPVVWARKPLSPVPLWGEVNDLHHMIGGLLWLSLSPAKRAELASPSSPAEQHGAWCASARVSAATATSPGGFAETGTCSSPATASTSSSIASSWSSILAALSAPTSTSTTSTRSSTTTALSTLSSLLAPLTSPTTMPRCGCLTSGPSSSAPSAASDSSDEWARWLHTLSASVPESAIEGTALVVASALAQAAASLSGDQGAASSAAPSATTGADASPSPAFEPVVVARKPLVGTVAANVTTYGTGALNIDGCRIEGKPRTTHKDGNFTGNSSADAIFPMRNVQAEEPSGRWPANVTLDEDVADVLDQQSGTLKGGDGKDWSAGKAHGTGDGATYLAAKPTGQHYADTGGASRFFYVAKAPKRERPVVDGVAHPTVKPLTLMRWLVRLVTPPGGTVLEPFAGSGTTVEACVLEGFRCIAIEKGDEYLPLIRERIHRQDAARIADEVTRRPDPTAAIAEQVVELGLFDLDEDTA